MMGRINSQPYWNIRPCDVVPCDVVPSYISLGPGPNGLAVLC